jgi:hypothetical protein
MGAPGAARDTGAGIHPPDIGAARERPPGKPRGHAGFVTNGT